METVSPTPVIDQTQVNIITSPEDFVFLGPEFKDLEFIALLEEAEAQMKHKPMRLNMEKARVASQIIGCKAKSANTLSQKIIDFYTLNIGNVASKENWDPSKRYHVYTSRDKFIALLRKFLPEFSMTKEQNVYDFELALEIIEQKKSLIILLGGTSGCGKSTVASLLASRFGIPTVLSTDSIRHVMRNFMSTDEFPVLFASTYEVATKVKLDENISEHKKTVLGFNQQAELIHQRLMPVILVTFLMLDPRVVS
jgi:ATP-dependent protease Clp ATPase subunit